MEHRKILLTPGPCMTSDAVRAAGAGPDLNHRDPEYLNLIRETKTNLLRIYPATVHGWTPYLLGGSGTLAVEAMITSCIKQGPVMILENGYYSSRIREIFDIHAIPYHAVSHEWLEPWDFQEIESVLAIGFEAVVGTHNETTTGRLNDISRLGELCHKYQARCLIDAMSSFGADPIEFRNIDAICASGNKCLHSIPGVGFVLVQDALRAEMRDVPRRSYYMSLPMYDGDMPPLTPPVPALAALREALREYPKDGYISRLRDYKEKSTYLREALALRGMVSPIESAFTSCTLTTVNLPSGWSYDEWFASNTMEGFIVYGCKSNLKDRFFQVSNMGELAMSDLEAWISAVDRILMRR